MDTYATPEDLANALRGNWQTFESFCWDDEPPDGENWGIIYTHNRDSGLVDQSNADQIEKVLSRFEGRTTQREHHNHWGCGWLDGWAIKCFRKDGQPTKAIEALRDLYNRLADYPVLDEEDHSRREYEATLENIQSAAERFIGDERPEDWPAQLLTWFWDNDQSAVENVDDQGGYPDDDQCKAALLDLGWLSDEYMPEPEEPCPLDLPPAHQDVPGQLLITFGGAL